MKKLALSAALALGLFAQGQTTTISNVSMFNLRNSGAIMNKDKGVDGYYFYYIVDKLKKGDREFAIQILDANLQDVATKSYIDNKNTFLMNTAFNNQAMMFAMANYKEKEITLITYDRQANQKDLFKIPLESKEAKAIQLQEQMGQLNVLFPVEDKGFLFNKVEDNKKIGYSLKYYPTDGGTKWEYNSPAESKEILYIEPIEVNKSVVVALEMSRPGALSRKITMTTKVIDINTGKLLFSREYSKKKNPRLITNAFLNADNTVVFMGEYFKEGDNIFDDKSLGLFTEVIDMTGNTVKENLISWTTDVAKLMKVKEGSKVKDKGYIYFHDVIKTQANEYYAIGEYYKKTVSGVGVAANLLIGAGSASMTQLTIDDAVVFKFDGDFKLTKVLEFDKGKSRAPSLTDFGSPQLNAHALKHYGAFDYNYTQIDRKNDRFYAFFTDYERLKGESNKVAFKALICDEGEITQDKIYLTGNAKFSTVLPSKIGTVMLLEYDKKAKTISLHSEKLNIK